MTLPVSSYEELLVQVRELTHETILLRRQLSSDLFENVDPTDLNHNLSLIQNHYEKGKLVSESVLRHCDQNHRIGPETVNFCDRSFQPSSNPNLATVDDELSTKLNAWRNQNRHSYQEVEGNSVERFDSQGQQASKQRLNSHTPNSVVATISTCGSAGRVGVEAAAGAAATTVSNTLEGNKVEQHDSTYRRAGQKIINDSLDNSNWSQRRNIDEAPHDSSRTRIINAVKSRAHQFPSTIIDRSQPKQQNVMEPEHKEEIDHESGTPSPELFGRSGKGYENDASSEDESRPSSSLQTQRLSSLYHGTWPVKRDVWNNQQYNFPNQQSTSTTIHNEMASIMSFSSTSGTSSTGTQSHRRLGAKVDVVYSLLGMLGRNEGREDMSTTLLSMSNSIESCRVMRQSGCLPLLVQLIHAPGQDPETRERAARALHNIIQARSDERVGRREVRVLRLLEQLRDYCQTLRLSLETGHARDDLERHPGATIAALMKLSFDEDHRHAMCQLGGLHAVAELIEMDHTTHGSECDDQNCITLRRYAGMALTNLTFGDGNNKALLCSFKDFMRALVSQLRSPSDDLRQVTASVLRNLSWRADSSSKQTLREVGAVIGLMRAAMEGKKESTLKSILSALWNLSAHCSTNKVDICAVEGALAFLVDMLSYKAPSKNFAIVENAGGILRNVSSHIAVRDDYRGIVRERGCLQVLLRQLRSPSLTIVSNACGALWNLSARCAQDQRLLWDLGAVPMLRSLVHSKHKMISMGSSAALKNLLSARPGCSNLVHLDSTARGLGLSTLPSLVARRQKALEQEIDQSLAETCENIEPSTSPISKEEKFFKVENGARYLSGYQGGSSRIRVARSDSRESIRSVTSTHSDTIFEKVKMNTTIDQIHQMKQQSASLHSAIGFEIGPSGDIGDKNSQISQSEKKYALRYKNANRIKAEDSLKRTGSTISWSTPGVDQEAACSQINSSMDKLSQASSCEFSFSRLSDDDHHRKNVSPIIEIEKSESGEKKQIEEKRENGDFETFRNSEEACGNYGEKLKAPYCDYAETDLDQTTDYSLRYAEHNSDDEKQSSAYFTCSEQNVLNGDTVKTYCTEGTPSQMSLNSSRATSASDLQEDIRPRNLFRTIAGSRVSAHHFCADEQITSGEDSGAASYRSLTIDDEHKITDDSKHKEFERKSRKTSSPCPVNLISEDDDDDDDQGLLAACINIGMQNNRHRQSFRRNSLEEEEMQAECNLTRYQTSNELNRVDNTATSNGETLKNSRYSMQEIAYDYQNEQSKESKKIPESEEKSSKIPELEIASKSSTGSLEPSSEEIIISGSCESFDSVERSEQALLEFCIQSRIPKVNDTITPTCQKIKETTNDSVDGARNKMEMKLEENHKVEEVYRRQRDPDAMIASLDRLTATLVQQTEAMRERESNAMKQSLQSDSWNEDSPNDVSFPSISVSAPLIASFKSDALDEHSAAKTSPENSCLPNLENSLGELENSREGLKNSRGEFENSRGDLKNPRGDLENSRGEFENSLGGSKNSRGESKNSRGLKNSPEELKNPPGDLVYQKDCQDYQDYQDYQPCQDFHQEDSDPMTDSRLIEEEAIKIAQVVSDQSLSSSYVTAAETYTIRDRFSLSSPGRLRNSSSRKKSLPIGVVAKRAINHQAHTSLENLSQLENVKPPSMMDEVLDIGDMENSMISVASIISEIADKDDSHSLTISDPVFDFVKPVANVLSMTCLRYAESLHMSGNNSLSECLENINPPSLFNEVTEMDESTMEGQEETLCSDTLCVDAFGDGTFGGLGNDFGTLGNTLGGLGSNFGTPGNTVGGLGNNIGTPATLDTLGDDTLCLDVDFEAPHFDRIEENDNDTDEAATPIPSEFSSAESTPKRRLRGHLTPKQKRQLAKERYKTYTIAAEIVKKEEDRRKLEQSLPGARLTPKQRRQEDRNRFQTQILDCPIVDPKGFQEPGSKDPKGFQEPGSKDAKGSQDAKGSKDPKEQKGLGADPKLEDKMESPVKSGIPMLRKVGKMRERGKDERFRTRTINESLLKEDPVHTMLEQNANIVLNTLNETTKGDELLDCETLSLVSNESGSEHFLQMRFTNDSKRMLQESRTRVFAYDAEEPRGIGREFEGSQENQWIQGDQGFQGNQGLQGNQCLQGNQGSQGNQSLQGNQCLQGNQWIQETQGIKRTQGIPALQGTQRIQGNQALQGTQRIQGTQGIQTLQGTQGLQALQATQGTQGIQALQGIQPIKAIQSQLMQPRSQRTRTHERAKSLDLSESASDDEMQKGPRIVKPGTIARDLSLDSEDAPRGIRGRRKPLHSSPTTRKTTPQSSPSKGKGSAIPIGRSNTSPIVRATRATTLRQNTNASAKSSPTMNQKMMMKRSSIPQKGVSITKALKRHSTPPGEMPVKLERQGTFTKDEPEVENAPTVPSLPSSPARTKGKGLIKPKTMIPKSLIPKKNESIPKNEIPKKSESSIPKKITTLGQRSNSNSSIQTPQGKKTKEATSKIASLWKRVEDSKLKQKFEKPDTRKWITGNGVDDNFRLFRSSTFEGMPKTISDSSIALNSQFSPKEIQEFNGVKYRNSCDLTGIPVKQTEQKLLQEENVIFRNSRKSDPTEMEIDIAKRISRLGSFIRVDESTSSTSSKDFGNIRTTASAIVPPFNYNPHQEISVQNAKDRKSDDQDFKSDIVTASARVTTV